MPPKRKTLRSKNKETIKRHYKTIFLFSLENVIVTHRPIMFRERSSNGKLRKRRSRRRLFRESRIDSGSREIDFDLNFLDPFVPILELLNERNVFPLFAHKNASFGLEARFENVLFKRKSNVIRN